jgi:hypothetical protein
LTAKGALQKQHVPFIEKRVKASVDGVRAVAQNFIDAFTWLR